MPDVKREPTSRPNTPEMALSPQPHLIVSGSAQESIASSIDERIAYKLLPDATTTESMPNFDEEPEECAWPTPPPPCASGMEPIREATYESRDSTVSTATVVQQVAEQESECLLPWNFHCKVYYLNRCCTINARFTACANIFYRRDADRRASKRHATTTGTQAESRRESQSTESVFV